MQHNQTEGFNVGKPIMHEVSDQYNNGELPPKFNAGLAKMIRIHELWRMCHAAKLELEDSNSFLRWQSCLFALKGEFIDRVKDEDKFVEPESLIEHSSDHLSLMRALSNYELFLHKVEKEVGYSVPDQKSIFDSE